MDRFPCTSALVSSYPSHQKWLWIEKPIFFIGYRRTLIPYLYLGWLLSSDQPHPMLKWSIDWGNIGKLCLTAIFTQWCLINLLVRRLIKHHCVKIAILPDKMFNFVNTSFKAFLNALYILKPVSISNNDTVCKKSHNFRIQGKTKNQFSGEFLVYNYWKVIILGVSSTFIFNRQILFCWISTNIGTWYGIVNNWKCQQIFKISYGFKLLSYTISIQKLYIYIYICVCVCVCVKNGGIKYHFWGLWYDSTLDWTPVYLAIGKQSTN